MLEQSVENVNEEIVNVGHISGEPVEINGADAANSLRGVNQAKRILIDDKDNVEEESVTTEDNKAAAVHNEGAR